MSEKESLKRIRLTVEGGPTREFPGDRTFVIGRSQNVDFSIPHPNLSREHVRISLKEGEVWMEDLGSANGTFVQGQKIPPKSVVKIKPHYRILLGTGSNVIITIEAVESSEPLVAPTPEPRGDVDLPETHEATKTSARLPAGRIAEFEASKTTTKSRGKMELDFPMQHFPQEAKKEKVAELRILEAKKQRVLEDIQYKEREVDDLRSKIRSLREESLKLKEATEKYKTEIQPLEDRKLDLEERVAELDITYEQKIDSLESGFVDLKQTLEESHSVRMARADKDFKEKTRRLDEDYARKLQDLENETVAVRTEGERLRDTLTQEKRDLEESLRRVRGEAEALEAERRLTQVRIDTDIAQLQGTKLKLENELETFRRKQEKINSETSSLVETSRIEQAKYDAARKALTEIQVVHENFVRQARAEQEQMIRTAQVEQEQFKKGIEEIKQSESKNIRRIEELKATIASLETKSNGIEVALKQAESDAAAIRRKGKEEVESLRSTTLEEIAHLKKSAQEQVEAQRLAVIKNAEAQAQAFVQETQAQALARVQNAESQANARTAAAENQANTRISSAEAQALSRLEAADLQASARMEKANAEAKLLLDRAQAEGNQYFEAKKMAADELLGSSQARAHELESGSKNHAERVAAEANSMLESKRRTLEAEMADLRKRTDQEIRQVRQNALADIESAKEREAKEFSSRLKGRVKEIGDQVDRIVGSKLAAQYGVNMDPVSMKTFSDEIHHIVETVIGVSKRESGNKTEKTLSTILPVNNQAQERAVLYWKKMGIAASVVVVLGLGKIIFPGAYTFLGAKIAAVADIKDNTDAVVKRMLRERQLAMTYVTVQDQQFRDNYTDNILYTEAFIEMKEDVEAQKVWTLALNRFFQGELGLTEKAIVQFGSAEGRMFQNLVDLRKEIIPSNSAAGIQKMRDLEFTTVKEIKYVMRSEGNWQKFQTFHRDFYTKYIQTNINRAPAAKDPAN